MHRFKIFLGLFALKNHKAMRKNISVGSSEIGFMSEFQQTTLLDLTVTRGEISYFESGGATATAIRQK